MNERRARGSYSQESKNQMVQLYNAGKPRVEIDTTNFMKGVNNGTTTLCWDDSIIRDVCAKMI